MKEYTEDQIRIAKQYEDRAFAAMNDPDEFDKIMKEFEEIQKTWG